MRILPLLILMSACSKEAPKIVEPRIECTAYSDELLYSHQYEHSADDILEFMQGEWILDTLVCSGRTRV